MPGYEGAQLWGVGMSRLQEGTVHLVYGVLEKPFGSLEAINTSGLQKGLQRVQLLKPDISVPALPADRRTMDIQVHNFLIPSKKTTYWCHLTKLPQDFPQHHIVMVPGGQRVSGPHPISTSLLQPQRLPERCP